MFNGLPQSDIGNPIYLIIPALLVVIPAGLILQQPDLGTSVKLTLVGLAVLFVAGVRLWKFLLAALSLFMIAPFLWLTLHDYQKSRLATFVDPENDPLGSGYHIIQSKIAFGSGGIFGKGFLLGSQSQLDFLPETQTDFIFSLIAEEWGLFGGFVVLALYATLIAMSLATSFRCQNHYGRLIAVGVTMNLFLYLFINVGMVMGVLPVVGVPLPLLSFGGTAMLAVMVALGLVMNVHIYQDLKLSRFGDEMR